MTKPRAPRKQLSDAQLKEFVVAWTRASIVADVATTTELPVSRCISTAVRLRKIGVKLKKLSGRPPVDVAELNKLIETTQRVASNQARATPAAEALAARRRA